MSTSNPYAAKDEGEPEVSVASEAAEPAVEAVPAGTAAEILEWVGDDTDRASRALEAEESGNQRKTLINKLRALLD